MADDESTGVDVDVELDDDDVDLEDIEVDLSDMKDNDDESEDITLEPPETEDDDEQSEEEPEAETEDNTEESDDEDAELSDEAKIKEHNRLMYEQRQQEKEARIQRVKQDQANYIAEASENRDPLELAVRQLQVTEYNNTVERVTNTITNQYEKALNDFAVLQTTDPVIQAEIDDAIDAFQSRFVTIDDYGNATEVRGDLYATLQAKADAITKLTGIRAAKQEQSKAREKSKTLATPNRAPREPKSDPAMDAFDEEANKW